MNKNEGNRNQREGGGRGRGRGGRGGRGNNSSHKNKEKNNKKTEIDSKELAKKGTGTPQHAQFRGNPSALNSSTKQTGSFNRNRDFQHNIPRAPNNLAVMSDNVKRFWQRLSSFLNSKPGSRAQNNAINLTDPVEVELWMQCWNAAAIGAIATNLNILPRVLLALPDGKESLPPPSIVLNVLSNLLNEIKISLMNKKHNSNERNRNPVAAENPYFADLEMILNVVRDRLRGPSHLLSAGYLDLEVPEMSNIIKLLSDKFSAITIEVLQQFPTDCERMGLLLSRTKDFNDFIQTIVSLPPTAVMKTGGSALMLHNTDNEGEADTGNAWLGWRDQPTVGWLMSTKWLHVPELGSRYANANEYAETVLRMWTLLCFYWGAGAVWPKCCHKEGKGSEDSICGQPMLTSCVHGAHCSSKFNGRPCENSAKWKCCKRNHDVICERCLYYQQTSLVGNPGLHASTDIYDAVVDRESVRREGSIYIASNLQSRKPPRIAPNWKTSYRLQPCALIGIVKLGSSREPLKRSSSIYWAEVVPVDAKNGSDFDWQARANGKIAFRLLSRGDCPALSVDADSLLELGTCLAIIDLRVFVPEVISVLSTFAQESFKSHLDQIPFIQCLIGQSPGVNLNLNYALSKTTVIAEAIKGSEIELIKRLTPDSLARLTQRICQLEQVKSLYGTQLEAFVDGLAGAVHCTQGPPGTGKSYVGVAVVLALVILREESQLAGYTVGPVLMLSYKNHALDEFLCDVLDFSSPKLNHGDLIRTGKAENPKLLSFGEKANTEEGKAMEELNYRVSVIRKAQKIQRDWRDCSMYFNMKLDNQKGWTSQVHQSPGQFGSDAVCLTFSLALYAKSLVFTGTSPMAFRFLESAYKHPIAESDVIEVKRELSQFVSQCEHWRCPARQRLSYAGEDIEFWLHSWLRGEFPPLRCQGVLPSESESGAQCMEVASNNSSYCTLLHACLSKNCVRERAPGGFIFCKYHKCDYTSIDNQFKCTSERFHGSSFCSQHTCINCLHQSETEYTKLEPVASDYGCCLKHQCQYFFGEKDQCLKAMLSPFLFCKDHCCHNCLKRGYPLDRPIAFVGDEQYCVEHKCSVKGCFKESIMENFVCADHVCLLCAYQGPQSQWNCIDLSVPKSRFCYNHRCSYFEDCMRPVADGSVFCASHSCRLCLDSNITPPLGIIVDNFPRNVCSSHMLCSHVFSRGTLCQSLAVAETPYCDYHNKLKDDFEIIRPTKVKERGLKKAVVIGDRCNGITKKTHQQCKTAQSLRMFGGKAYCKDHQAQSGVKVEDSNVDDNGDNDDDDDGIFSEEEMALEKESYILQQFVIDSHNNSDQKLFDELMQIRERVHLASQFKSLNTPVFRCSSTDCRAYLYQPDSEPMVYCARHRPNRIYEVDHMEVDDDNGVDDGHIAEEIMDLEDSAGPTNADDTHLIDEPIKNASIVEDPIATGLVEIADPIVDVLEDVADDVAGDIHPDELDMVYEDEDELNEEQRRLKDIIDKDDNDDSDDESIQSAFDGQEGKVNTSFLESDAQDYDERFAKQLVQSWDWNMPTEQRWESVAKFLHCMSVIINNLRLKAADHIVDARERRAEASAKSFRKAKIVGSTVVGASRRLEAIRIAEPFAVVVEECCEVMEPTLLAVLAVKSLRKLEMIGDHRQLPAFVQTYWYNLELTHRSIKVSLFERLVEGSNNSKNQCPTKRKADDEDAIPLRCSILDEQRRMRTAIADLTRPEYADLVAIKDHPHTSRQKVGDVFLKTSRDNKKMEELKANRSLWETNGREVPGVLPSVFFWDLTDNREGKPVAGLSACNPTEAEAVGCLTRHMITCGIPPSSITIITPYKGQKTMLTKILRSMNVLPKYNPSVVQDFSTCVNISTVDRYQGDENDIVILSLVKTRPGNRFVGLSNRFVVAASRARLGCYIVGTAEAVVKDWQGHDGPPHWRRFFEDLTNVIPGAPATSVANDFIFSEARVSSSIPICCPRHRTQTARNVAKISEFPSHENWNNFCCHPCAYQLPTCTHLCAKLCHSPSYTAHTERCEVTIDSPCPIHYATKLVCNEVLGTAPTLQKALDRFECAIEVSHHRPECNHVVAITCHLNSLIDSGQRSLPNCEEIVGDFVHPQCNHLFSKPACYRRRSYEKTPPMCKEKVVHTRSCGCKVLMRCHQRIAEMEMTQPPSCLVDVTIARPRCSHKLSLRCHEAKTLQQQWQQLNTIDTVEPTKFGNILLKSGCTYGPDESLLLAKIPRCSVMVDYMNKCGHVMQNIPCHKAFNFANGSIAVEPCQSLVRMSSPLCSHIIEIPCWLEAQVKAWEPWGAGVEPEFDENFFFVSEQLLRSVSCIDLGIIDIMKKACIKSMRVRRECNHLHITSVSCSRLFDFIVTKNPLDVCTEIVSRNLPCGHLTNVPCCKRFDRPPLCREKIEDVYTHSCRIHSVQPRVCHKYHQLLSMNPPPVCADPVTSNRYRCDHLITVACGISEKVVAESPGARLLDQVDPYTVEEDLNYCRGEVDIPICSEVVKFKRSCGHIITDIQCHTAFAFADKTIQIPHCDQIEVCVSPLCGHSIELACSTKPRLMEWVAWPNLGPVYEEILDTTASDCDQVIRVLREESIEEYAANLPPPLVKNQLECNSPILFVRKCGHSLKVRCVDILFGTDGIGRCSDVVVYRCELCMSDRKTSCYDYVTQKVSGVFRPCTNEVEKCCSLCNVNIVKTSCGNSNPLCNKIVNFNLQCSHNVSWRCGKEEDPRNRQFQCRICVHGKWLETLDQHSKSKGRLLELGSQLNFIPRVRDAIGGYEVLRMVDINVSINNFYNARMNIIQDFATVLGKGSKIDLMLPPEMFASQIDVDSYHIVYKGKKGMLEESQYKQFLTIPGDGVFGRCVYINRLTSPAQLEELEETDGVVKVVFGVAFSLRLLQDSPPFGIDTNAEKKIDTKQMEKINKKMQNFKSCGYDGVLLPQKPNTTTQGVAYWTPSIVLPVCYAELKIHVKCSLCLDYFASKDGFFCSNRHFICWESCFEGYVKSANSPNPIQRSVDTDGNLTCPECKESYDLQRVGMNGPANSFQSLLKLKTDCIANQRTKEALDAEVARAASEFERIMKLDLEDRIAALVHRDIVDEILTLKCPRCKTAFDEFEGCCAVSCHCTSSFCAFCLKDCGEDAHGHVAQCIENPTRGDVFCSQDVLKGQRKNRWRRLILERLRRESQNTQKKVKELLIVEISDLGINL